jgi:alkanesulfonate monooxygenase SsuD/methylene tetrahydromethanopterin reductase-like flavin-dependent oxidoreductase (luciferase family)
VAAHRDPDAITVSVMGAVFAAPDRAALSELIRVQAAARSIPPEELEGRLASSGIPYGTPDQVAETLAELEAVGVSKLYIQWFDLADLAGLETIWAGLPR